jgi:hypothetical protein
VDEIVLKRWEIDAEGQDKQRGAEEKSLFSALPEFHFGVSGFCFPADAFLSVVAFWARAI